MAISWIPLVTYYYNVSAPLDFASLTRRDNWGHTIYVFVKAIVLSDERTKYLDLQGLDINVLNSFTAKLAILSALLSSMWCRII